MFTAKPRAASPLPCVSMANGNAGYRPLRSVSLDHRGDVLDKANYMSFSRLAVSVGLWDMETGFPPLPGGSL